MYKDELICLHHFLLCLSRFLTDNGAPERNFNPYYEQNINPHQPYKKKGEHKQAVRLLACGISRCLSESEGNVPGGLVKRLEDLASRCLEKDIPG
jgi:hypothetical protein